jgi:hypothetical protein
MPGTRRVPLTRRSTVRITNRAVEIFVREMEPRRKRCTCERATKERWTGLRQCKSCTEWWEAHNRLADEFTKPYPPPWHWPLVPSPQGHSSEPGGDGPLQEQLAAELRAAAREMRKPEPEPARSV